MSERRLNIGIQLAAEQFPPAEIVELAVAAEQAGFDALSLSDHFHPWQENQGHAVHAWAALAAIGQRTEHLILGTAVTCPTYRLHPAQVAHFFATLAVLYPGRVFLGLGTGEALNEESATGQWGQYRERANRLEEAIDLIRQLWSGGWIDFDGSFYQTRSARIFDLPSGPIPIYVAASGPMSAALAGRAADGWITDPYTARHRDNVRASFEDAARKAGRNPEELPRIVELWCVAGDREAALADAPLWQFLPMFNDVIDVADPRQVQRLAHERSSPQRAADGWLVSPDPAAHAASIEQLVERGATHVFIHSPQPDQRKVIDFYAHGVLPKLRR
jgi:TAT-translocated FGD2 family F420-dependent dehydrogenase